MAAAVREKQILYQILSKRRQVPIIMRKKQEIFSRYNFCQKCLGRPVGRIVISVAARDEKMHVGRADLGKGLSEEGAVWEKGRNRG